MGRLDQRKRNKHQRERNSVVVVKTEGRNQTEENYIKHFSSRQCPIRPATGRHTNPMGMVEDLVKFIKENEFSTDFGDSIFLILDTDVNKQNQDEIEKVKQICNKYGIELIISTPTFEYWFLLHFEETAKRYTSSIQVKRELKERIPGYTESMDVYPIIKDGIQKAIEVAKRIENNHLKNGKNIFSDEANPHTNVYKLVEELLRRNNL